MGSDSRGSLRMGSSEMSPSDHLPAPGQDFEPVDGRASGWRQAAGPPGRWGPLSGLLESPEPHGSVGGGWGSTSPTTPPEGFPVFFAPILRSKFSSAPLAPREFSPWAAMVGGEGRASSMKIFKMEGK